MNRGMLGVVVLLALASCFTFAEDPKTRKDRTVDKPEYGCTAVKPDAAEWQLVQGSEEDKYFQPGTKVIIAFARFSTATPDKTKDSPMIFFYVLPLDIGYFDRYGSKGLAKAIYEDAFKKDYKDLKGELPEARKNQYRFGAVSEFTFTGVNTKYNNPRTVHFMCFKYKRDGFQIVMEGIPDMVKKYAAECQYCLDNLNFYEPKK